MSQLVQSQPPGLLCRPASTLDRLGLVWGYRLAPGAAPIALDQLPCEDAPVWLHFNLADARARKWLQECAQLPGEALSMLLEAQPRASVLLLPDAMVGIVQDLHHGFHGDPEGFGDLRFYVDETRVITARRHPLQTIDALRRALAADGATHSTASWLGRFLEGLATSFADVVYDLSQKVDDLEDEIIGGQGHERRATLAAIRRLLVRFRRHLNSDRSELAKLRQRHRANGAQSPAVLHALDRLDGAAQDLELVHERVRLLQEELSGMLAEATNRNLYVLSVVTTVLLPTSVLTGIWGMNVGGLPWSHDAHGFLWVGLGVLASVVLSLALLRGTRVL